MKFSSLYDHVHHQIARLPPHLRHHLPRQAEILRFLEQTHKVSCKFPWFDNTIDATMREQEDIVASIRGMMEFDVFHLPHPKTYFEILLGEGKDNEQIWAILAEEIDHAITAKVWWKPKNSQWVPFPGKLTYPLTGHADFNMETSVRQYAVDAYHGLDISKMSDYDLLDVHDKACGLLGNAFWMIRTAIVLLDTDGVTRVAKKDRFKTSSKPKAALPFFTYTEITVSNDHIHYETNGTTGRKSPRLHLRRGHGRNLPNGNRIWIKPMLVGHVKDGVTHNNYHLDK